MREASCRVDKLALRHDRLHRRVMGSREAKDVKRPKPPKAASGARHAPLPHSTADTRLCTEGLDAIRKEAVLFCGSFPGKDAVFANLGLGVSGARRLRAAPEATQGYFDVFLSQLQYNCYQNRVASVGNRFNVRVLERTQLTANQKKT